MRVINNEQLVQDVLDGIESPFKALAELRTQENQLKKCIEVVYAIAKDESEKEPTKTFERDGFTFMRKEGGRTWNFKGVQKWIDAKRVLEAVETECKQAYSAKENNMLIAGEGGEEIELPIVTFKADSLTIKS